MKVFIFATKRGELAALLPLGARPEDFRGIGEFVAFRAASTYEREAISRLPRNGECGVVLWER